MYESRVNDRREAVASSWLSRRDKISNKVLLIVVIVPILSVICVFSISVVKNHGNEIRVSFTDGFGALFDGAPFSNVIYYQNVAISSPKAEKYTDSRDRFQGVRVSRIHLNMLVFSSSSDSILFVFKLGCSHYFRGGRFNQ